MSVLPRLDLKVGFACNNRCRFCVQGDKRSRYAPKPTAELRRILEEGRPSRDAVVFTGGEPTLRDDLPELVSHARHLGYRQVQVQTNGRMFAYRGYAEKLLACGVTEFSPALHGSTAEIHDALTCAVGSYAQTVAGIKHLRALGAMVLTNSVITRRNTNDLPALAAHLDQLDVQQMQFAFVHPVGSAGDHFDEVVPRMSDIAAPLHAALAFGRRAGRRVMTEAIPYCIVPGFEDCVAEETIPPTLVVDAEGTIASYEQYRREQGKRKGPDCPRCRYEVRCEGPWREYPERFGFEEFRPVAGLPQQPKGRP